MRKSEIILLCLVLLSFLVGGILYPQMPERMASHWNAQGEVDGYMSRFFAIFLLPFVLSFLLALFLLIPRIDPLRANIAEFRQYYDMFFVVVTAYMLYIFALMIVWNMGISFNMMQALAPAMALLFYCSGVLIEHAKKNWFVGIRTPWTLSSEAVWEKTHRLGGKLFKISAACSLLGIPFPSYAIVFILVPVLLSSAYLVVYSYLEYEKEKRHKGQ